MCIFLDQGHKSFGRKIKDGEENICQGRTRQIRKRVGIREWR